jgi:hypothetical protein
MRRETTTVLLTLIAALALSAAITSSAAAALPEFEKEGKPLAETVKYTGTIDASTWEGAVSSIGESREGTIAGELTGPAQIADTELVFKKLESSYPCRGSELAGKGINGTVGYVGTGKKAVGILLESTTTPMLKCGKLLSGIGGSIIGSITPLNKSATSFKVVYRGGGRRGTQELTHFEGSEVLHQWELTANDEELAFDSEVTLTTSKAIELKA